MAERASSTRRAAAWTAKLAFKLLATAIVIAVPILGVWAGSSLAAYLNGPIWLAILAGVLMFPLLPLAWDAWAQWRRKRRDRVVAPILTLWDRLIVRTFVLSFTFLAAFIALSPATIFTAVSTRGDWMMDGWSGETADAARENVLAFADRLSWLYEATHDNPYDDVPNDDRPVPPPAPHEWGDTTARVDDARPVAEDSQPATDADVQPREEVAEALAAPPGPPNWPVPTTLHPLVRDIPPSEENDIASVARYIAAHEPDPYRRVKALHDWVADRIAYDAPALRAETRPPQDAASVFERRTAVCAGYAKLMVALGEAIDEEIVYVVGDARTDSTLTGDPHAWNAVRIEDRWYLIDVTWDSGFVEGSTFTKRYDTSNFLTPPAVFSVQHLPDDPRWQLRDDPISRGEFFRQPMMRPEFYARGLSLLSPTRSQVDAAGSVEILLDNPRSRFFLVKYQTRAGGTQEGECAVTNGRQAKATCNFPWPGRWEVTLFDGPQLYGSYVGVGSIEVNSR